MFSTIILAIFKLGLPVGAGAYLLIGWLRDSGRLGAFANRKELEASLKAYKKEGKEKKKQKQQAEKEHFAIKKWMNFGGGFYGTAALYTYAMIEIAEIFGFFGKVANWILTGSWVFPDLLSLIIGFLINSLKNLLSALLWFQYWDLGPGGLSIAVAFLAAYAGYAVGAHYANLHAAEGIGHVELWRWWLARKKASANEAGSSDADRESQP